MDTLFTMDLFAKKAQEVIAEGCVLLRNHGRALPLEAGCRVAVFGRTQMNDYKSGLGSGGLVNTRYVTGIFAALKALGIYTMDETVRQAYEAWTEAHPFDMGDGWSNHPWYQQEMPLEETFVCEAAERNDAAVILGAHRRRGPGQCGRRGQLAAGSGRESNAGRGVPLLFPHHCAAEHRQYH